MARPANAGPRQGRFLRPSSVAGSSKKWEGLRELRGEEEIQRALGVGQGAVVIDCKTTDLNLVWPWVKNWYAFQAKGLDNRPGLYRYAWLDQSLMS